MLVAMEAPFGEQNATMPAVAAVAILTLIVMASIGLYLVLSANPLTLI
jgi:hypothetical protein